MVSGLGPTCTDKIFSPDEAVVLSAVPVLLSVLPQAVKPRTIVTASIRAITLFFIVFPPLEKMK
jgi:hypothetical protein